MRSILFSRPSFKLLHNAFLFIQQHWVTIFVLGLVAGLGRVCQLGGFGPLPAWVNVALEVVIQGARILLFLFIIGFVQVQQGDDRITGFAQLRRGGRRILTLFTQRQPLKNHWRVGIQQLRQHWRLVLINCLGFLAIAGIFNYLIDLLAYETCLLLTMKGAGILAAPASEWTILLFFKNLSVIPFTLVFEALLVLWLVNRFGALPNGPQERQIS